MQEFLIKNTSNPSVMSFIKSSDLFSKSIMVILFFLSVVSWAIVIDKFVRYYRIKRKIKNFERIFWSGNALEELYEKTRKNEDSILAKIFVSAMQECKKSNLKLCNDSHRSGIKKRLLQVMDVQRNREVFLLESNLTFLAVVGSKATFIGLLGTVWGIIQSFQSIAVAKNASLAVVAPGVSEALIATAVGLFVSIPAVMFYNFFISQVESIDNKLYEFVNGLHVLLTRAIDEGKI